MDKENLKKRMDHRDPANRLFLACPCLLLTSIFLYLASRILAPSPTVINLEEGSRQDNADSFTKIAMKVRIMPSQNTEDNFMLMVEETGTSEFEGDYSEGLPDALTDNFFTIDSTVGYFPVMRFTE